MMENNERVAGTSMFRVFKDTTVTNPNKYTIDGVDKVIIPNWGITEQGTLDKAEHLNQMQYNDIFKVMGSRKIESHDEIYDIAIPGIGIDNINFDANLLFAPNSINATATPKIRLNGNKYVIKKDGLPILPGDLATGALIGIRLNFSNLEAEIFSITERTFSSQTRNNSGLVPASGTEGSSRTLMENGGWGCPTPVGGLLFLTQEDNPNTIYNGTTWEKLKGYYLKCTSDNEPDSGLKGGENTKTISVENLPVHTHGVTDGGHEHLLAQNPHNHNIPPHRHRTHKLFNGGNEERITSDFGHSNPLSDERLGAKVPNADRGSKIFPYTSREGGGETSSTVADITCLGALSHIRIDNTGNGVGLDIQPSYYTVHTWKRLS